MNEKRKQLSLKARNKGSTLPRIFNILGAIIFVGGFLGGVILIKPNSTIGENNWQIIFIYWFGALLSGMFFLGFGKIIKLLEDINNKLTK